MLRVANKKSEVELLQDFLRNNGRVAWLCDRVLVRERRIGRTRRRTARCRSQGHATIVVAVDILSVLRRFVGLEDRQSIRADTALNPLERGCDGCGLTIRRQEVVCDVLDKDTLALLAVSTLMHEGAIIVESER